MTANPAEVIRAVIDGLPNRTPPTPTSYRDLDDEHLLNAYYAVEDLKSRVAEAKHQYQSQINRGDLVRLPGIETRLGGLSTALETEAILIEGERRKRKVEG